jgi:hypothetical protein
MELKICSKCNTQLSLSSFYLISKKKRVPRSECKKCCYTPKPSKPKVLQSKEERLQVIRNHYQLKKTEILDKKKAYRSTDAYKKNHASWKNKYVKKKKMNDPGYKFIHNLRIRQNYVLKGRCSTTKSLGCNRQELLSWILPKLKPGMTLENYGNKIGQWSLDHIKPLSSYERNETGNWSTTSEYNRSLIHYTNLNPLWVVDNLKKSNKTGWN